jgi:hypothetical protein
MLARDGGYPCRKNIVSSPLPNIFILFLLINNWLFIIKNLIIKYKYTLQYMNILINQKKIIE